MKKYDYILVGGGLYAGAFAWYARKNKKRCLVVEKRDHTGGSAYCEDVESIHVHKYGAYIFYTGNRKVWEFVNSLAELNRYTSSPVANYRGQMYNVFSNTNIFSRMWGISTPDEVKVAIEKQRVEITGEPENLEEQAIRLAGRELYEKLIKGYTERQWGKGRREFPTFIIKRIPVRYIYDNSYFNDPYQGIPVGGYNVIVRRLLEGCDIETSMDCLEHREHYNSLGETVVYTDIIDAFYGYRFGRLEYRSLCFESQLLDQENHQGVAVVNYMDRETPYTRIIEHKHFELDIQLETVITREYLVNWQGDMEPYYPVNDQRNQEPYQKYEELTGAESHVLFGGRLGEYKYYDMGKAVEPAMDKAEEISGQGRIKDRKDTRQMTKTQDRQVYLDVAKDMGMLEVVASHCLAETSLGILLD